MIAALDASNRLVTDLWGKSGTSVNVDLLFGFAARAFHSHHDKAFGGHRWGSMCILPFAAPTRPDSLAGFFNCGEAFVQVANQLQ